MFTYLTLLFYAASVSAQTIVQNTTAPAPSSLPFNSTATSTTAPGPSNSTAASMTALGSSNSTVASTTSAAATTPSSGAFVARFGQCGGATYMGPTACASPFTCTKFSDYYSECL
ncbi:hypothetical protein EV421DRAFT_624739 [Armillaria borealis]|uniref:CBM1 domain-containing protein n=1 Tax=Armillaria borealis TaxID=47425 RepID=A0AA39ICD0_9AGAR|nr:hypothetical protein EV421DRAFT_624739 [Armillaria borealis]